MSKFTPEKFNKILDEEVPFTQFLKMQAQEFTKDEVTLVLPYQENSLRPGGTISGPALMALADVCMYAAVLNVIGEEKLALTTNLNINFLNRPYPDDIIAKGRVLKQGKRLIILEVSLYNLKDASLIAHATGTYSVPPKS